MKTTNTMAIGLSITFIVIVSMLLLSLMMNPLTSNAQQAPTSRTITTAGINFTKLISQNKEFQTCSSIPSLGCFPAVDVVYQGPIMLVT